MSALTINTCVLSVKDQMGNPLLTSELEVESRKSQIHSSDAVYINRPNRAQAVPGIVVQDLLYVSQEAEPETDITVIYTGGGTAGAEVVTVVGTAISVQIQTATSTATQIKTAVNNSAAASALVRVITSGTGSTAQVTFSPAVTLSDAYCVLDLAESTTDSQQVIFTLNWDIAGKNYNSTIFDPVLIPNSSFTDLSTILTVSRG